MSNELYEVTLRRNGRDVDNNRVPPFLVALDLDDKREAAVADARLYRALLGAAKRAGCTDLAGELDEYDLQVRERGRREVKDTFASHWRDPDVERRR